MWLGWFGLSSQSGRLAPSPLHIGAVWGFVETQRSLSSLSRTGTGASDTAAKTVVPRWFDYSLFIRGVTIAQLVERRIRHQSNGCAFSDPVQERRENFLLKI